MVESLQSAFSSPGLTTAAVDPKQVIDQVFDFAEKMLEVQREFAKISRAQPRLPERRPGSGPKRDEDGARQDQVARDAESQRPCVAVPDADLTRLGEQESPADGRSDQRSVAGLRPTFVRVGAMLSSG